MPAKVHFLLGRANTGKTHSIFQSLEEAKNAGRRAVLLVPEQYTFETERALSRRLGGLLGIQVLSFERLAVRATGAQDRPFLSAQGRRMVMRRIAYQNASKLEAFASVAHRAGFAAHMDTLYVLCKRYCIPPDMLREAAQRLPHEPGLAAKLQDMALLFSAMQQYLDEHFIDSEDALNAFLQSIPHSFLKNADVYIDGLDGLHTQLFLILESLLQHCASLTITFCLDPNPHAPDAKLFASEQAAYERLQEMAASLGCAVYTRKLAPYTASRSHALCALEGGLFAHDVPAFQGEAEGISLTGAPDRTAEVAHMADSLLALARGGIRYRDMAVVASDMGAYSIAVQRAFAKRDIPVFFDARRSMQGHPAVELLLAAARVAANGLSRVELVRIAKTGLAGVSQAQTEAFENHCLRRGILGGGRLEAPFSAGGLSAEKTDPKGAFVEKGGKPPLPGELPASPPSELDLAEMARAALTPPLLKLRASFTGTAAEMTRALYAYLEALGVQQQLSSMVNTLGEQGRFGLMEEHAQVWDILMELFSQLHAILGEAPMRRREYLEVLGEALSAYRVGMIPATADQVLFGDIARTRSREVRVLFVLGCNEGLFLQPRLDDALLDDAELAAMGELGIAPWENTAAQAQGDQLTIYRTLSKASAQLHFSFSYSDGSRELVPAVLLDRLHALFPTLREQSARKPEGTLPQSEGGGFSELLRHFSEKPPSFDILRSYYRERPIYADRLRQVEAFVMEPAAPAALGEPVARKLYGSRLHTSVSRLETYRACPFRHFALYGIGARSRREFKARQADIGSFSHLALDAFVRRVREGGLSFHSITFEQAETLLDALLPACLENYEDGLLIATPRMCALSIFWCDAVRATAHAMCRMLRAGSFQPAQTELRFGQGGLPAVPAGDAMIYGTIDRLDTAPLPDGRDLVRVVDYKTGSAELRYPELADGLSLQLAIYLAAAAQRPGAIPTGLYYQPVKDPAEEEEDSSAAQKKLRLSGMLVDGDAARAATAGDLPLKDISKSALLEPAELDALLQYAVRRAGTLAGELLRGRVAAAPVYRGRGSTCTTCDYKAVCRFDVRLKGCRIRRVRPCTKEEFFRLAGLEEQP